MAFENIQQLDISNAAHREPFLLTFNDFEQLSYLYSYTQVRINAVRGSPCIKMFSAHSLNSWIGFMLLFFSGSIETHLWGKKKVKINWHFHRQEHDSFVSPLFDECLHEQSQESTLSLGTGAERWSRNRTRHDSFSYTECLASLFSFF